MLNRYSRSGPNFGRSIPGVRIGCQLLSGSAAVLAEFRGTMESLFWLPNGDLVPKDWNTQQLSLNRRSIGSVRMLSRSFRMAVLPVCALAGVLLVSGCASKGGSSRASRFGGRVMHHITPEKECNLLAEPDLDIPPAPGASDPLPPPRSTSDLPPAPPRDDFESAERPGRHSASFAPYTGHVTPASRSSEQLDAAL